MRQPRSQTQTNNLLKRIYYTCVCICMQSLGEDQTVGFRCRPQMILTLFTLSKYCQALAAGRFSRFRITLRQFSHICRSKSRYSPPNVPQGIYSEPIIFASAYEMFAQCLQNGPFLQGSSLCVILFHPKKWLSSGRSSKQ